MGPRYFWATRGEARLLEKASALRMGYLDLMSEAKPIEAACAALAPGCQEPEPAVELKTNCRDCANYLPEAPSSQFDRLERAGVVFSGQREEYFGCRLCHAPMSDPAGNCRQFEPRK